MKILLWHVHGSWTTSFVQGSHDYVVPVTPDRDADGLGRARTWTWPENVVERSPGQLADEDFDVVLLQRPSEVNLIERWLRRRPGRELPAVYVEHNAPEPHPVFSRHVLADQAAIPIVHVTPFNELYWDSGTAPTRVIEHGVIDPGCRYTGELARAAVVVNDPMRRGRMVGADLLPRFAEVAPLDLFGMRVSGHPHTTAHEDLPQHAMHRELARRRVYLHPVRWTSLGLSLIEAMYLGLPVVAVAATQVVDTVPPEAGVVSTDIDRLAAGLRRFVHEPEAARQAGQAGRRAAIERHGLARFLADWDDLLKEVVG
jgi:Glycosyl transferases group 1